MTFHILVHTASGGRASIQVHNSHMEMWGVTGAEIFECAQRNTPARMAYSLTSMSECLGIPMEDGGIGRFPGLYILTNHERLYGAGCILYGGLLGQIAGQLGSGFYVLPSSVHETLLLPSDGHAKEEAEGLKKMVAEINRSEVPAEDILIDAAYYYDKARQELLLVA